MEHQYFYVEDSFSVPNEITIFQTVINGTGYYNERNKSILGTFITFGCRDNSDFKKDDTIKVLYSKTERISFSSLEPISGLQNCILYDQLYWKYRGVK